MSGNQIIKHPLVQAAAAGVGAMVAYASYSMLFGTEVAATAQDKKTVMNRVLENLKTELKLRFEIEPLRSLEDGLLTKDFMVKMHTLIYKYKKYAMEMLADTNWRLRIELLRQAMEIQET